MANKAIGRAYGGEPVVLEVLGIQGEVVSVLRTEGRRRVSGLCLIRDLFAFDESLLGKLRRAYQRKDSQTLGRVWGTARPLRKGDPA